MIKSIRLCQGKYARDTVCIEDFLKFYRSDPDCILVVGGHGRERVLESLLEEPERSDAIEDLNHPLPDRPSLRMLRVYAAAFERSLRSHVDFAADSRRLDRWSDMSALVDAFGTVDRGNQAATANGRYTIPYSDRDVLREISSELTSWCSKNAPIFDGAGYGCPADLPGFSPDKPKKPCHFARLPDPLVCRVLDLMLTSPVLRLLSDRGLYAFASTCRAARRIVAQNYPHAWRECGTYGMGSEECEAGLSVMSRLHTFRYARSAVHWGMVFRAPPPRRSIVVHRPSGRLPDSSAVMPRFFVRAVDWVRGIDTLGADKEAAERGPLRRGVVFVPDHLIGRVAEAVAACSPRGTHPGLLLALPDDRIGLSYPKDAERLVGVSSTVASLVLGTPDDAARRDSRASRQLARMAGATGNACCYIIYLPPRGCAPGADAGERFARYIRIVSRVLPSPRLK